MAIARSVAIIGGGIGGLTVANALLQMGMSVSVYERFPYFIPTAGAGFTLQPNGQISLESIGFKDQIDSILHPFVQWQYIDDNGEILSKSNRLGEYKKRFGYAAGAVIRSELVDLLKDPIEKIGSLHYSHNMINIRQDKNGVTLMFENENRKKSVQVDMVIGADGIHSTVAQQIFPQTALPVYSKQNIFYGIIHNIDQQTSINSTVTAKNAITQYFGSGQFISYRVGNEGQFMWAATYSSVEPPSTINDIEWSEMKNQRELNHFLNRFPLSHPVHQCAAATDRKRLLHFGLFYRQHRNDSWHRNRVCLLGDSCHATLPNTGQGANMAIEDAIILTQCLEKFQFKIEPAFQEYYNKRFKRTKRVVDGSKHIASFSCSENRIVHLIRRHLVPWLMNSDMIIKIAEKELYENSPIPIQKKKTA